MDVLYILGDVISRGPKGLEVLQKINEWNTLHRQGQRHTFIQPLWGGNEAIFVAA